MNLFSVLGTSAGYLPTKEFISLSPADQTVSASHVFGAINSISSFGGGYGDQNGATLTSLAHSSAIQAKNAVQNQDGAGSQAEYGAKSNLASVATGVNNKQIFTHLLFKRLKLY